MSKEYVSSDAVNYWNRLHLGDGYSCPNVSLFRFLGYNGFVFRDKKVLEIGFGANRGKDLLECQARGAMIFGADLNKSFIEDFKKNNPKTPVEVMNAGCDRFPFSENFDLIFHRDVIYYLSDREIQFHLRSSCENLNAGGYLTFQFIEGDLSVDRSTTNGHSHKVDFEALKNSDRSKMYRGETNPIRTLDIDWLISEAQKSGFKLRSTKTCIESYTPDESIYRIDRYLLLQK